ncbi:hypothetical protein [Micromonospora sp. NPDC005707]|uniref:hypothetical protein n=1 Tax=Micromonospora sp. NPDC005707 TaxID=3157050 RepID=UPI0033FBC10A
MNMIARERTRRAGAALITLVVAAAGILSGQRPAHADSVWAMGGSVIINVQTGAKDTSNHTQWVSSIYIQTGTAADNSYGCGTFEAWTQGFYAQAERCEAAYWTINRWVENGNYVCGAFDDFGGWPRRIACIAIRV